MTGKATKRTSIKKYLKETKAELKKVSWPTKKETVQHTEVVLIAIALIAIVVGLVDAAFSMGLNLFIGK